MVDAFWNKFLHTKDLRGWDRIDGKVAVSTVTFLCGQVGRGTVLLFIAGVGEMRKNLLASKGCVRLGMAICQMQSWRFSCGEINWESQNQKPYI